MTHGTPSPYEPPPRGAQGPGGAGRGPARRRSLPARLLPLGVAAWVVLEIWLLMLLGDAAGGLAVFVLLAAGFVLGALAIKRAGRRAWHNLSATLQAGTDPGAAQEAQREQARAGGGNALSMLGGLLLMTPGMVSDAAGLFCLFPPTAALLRRGTERLMSRGELGEAMRQARGAGEQVRIHRPDGKIVQGEVLRDDEPPGH